MGGWWGISVSCWRDPRLCRAGLKAAGLWFACLSRFGADFVPDWFVDNEPSGGAAARKLIREQLWVRVDGGYRFIEWADLATRIDDMDAEGWR